MDTLTFFRVTRGSPLLGRESMEREKSQYDESGRGECEKTYRRRARPPWTENVREKVSTSRRMKRSGDSYLLRVAPPALQLG